MFRFCIIVSCVIGFVFIVTDFQKNDINESKELQSETYRIVKEIAEEAYAEGQKDALEGRIIIEHIDSNMYRFNSSPWNDGTMFEKETLFLDK